MQKTFQFKAVIAVIEGDSHSKYTGNNRIEKSHFNKTGWQM